MKKTGGNLHQSFQLMELHTWARHPEEDPKNDPEDVPAVPTPAAPVPEEDPENDPEDVPAVPAPAINVTTSPAVSAVPIPAAPVPEEDPENDPEDVPAVPAPALSTVSASFSTLQSLYSHIIFTILKAWSLVEGRSVLESWSDLEGWSDWMVGWSSILILVLGYRNHWNCLES